MRAVAVQADDPNSFADVIVLSGGNAAMTFLSSGKFPPTMRKDAFSLCLIL